MEVLKVTTVEEIVTILLPQTPEKARELVRWSFYKRPPRMPSWFLWDFIEVTMLCFDFFYFCAWWGWFELGGDWTRLFIVSSPVFGVSKSCIAFSPSQIIVCWFCTAAANIWVGFGCSCCCFKLLPALYHILLPRLRLILCVVRATFEGETRNAFDRGPWSLLDN